MSNTAKAEMNRAVDAVKSASGADPSLDDITAQLETLRADMAKLVETMASVGRTKTDAAAHSLADAATDLRRKGEENLGAVRDHSEAALVQAADYVRKRPTEAVAVAAGLGVLLGLFLNRR